ncbi:MAG: GNAT family N-acetyltransferase [Candidatus Rokubacteria bacterium]|nr:GNAT family N-acetyltransferase [Candidatus Rokubacteria bacterium]
MIRLRDARPDELDTVADVMVDAYAEYRAALPEPAWIEYRAEIRDIPSRMPASTLIVAEDAGSLLGAVTYYPDARLEGHVDWPEHWANFRLLAVAPSARGRGVGRLLTEECIRRARAAGREALGLHTTRLMQTARAMYERMGWVRVPELDFFPVPEFQVMAYRLTL